jgi:hypothetical protein
MASNPPQNRGGLTFAMFRVGMAGKHVDVTTFEEPDGKIEQYLVRASGD